MPIWNPTNVSSKQPNVCAKRGPTASEEQFSAAFQEVEAFSLLALLACTETLPELPATHAMLHVCQQSNQVCQALSHLHLQEGTAKLLDAAKSSPTENGRKTPLEGAALLQDPTLLRAWQAVRFVSAAAKGQWGINGAFLAPQLLRFLPSLLKLQVNKSGIT